MLLYNLTLQPSTSITKAILGNFSGQKTQELVLGRSSRLDLVRPNLHTGKLATVLSHELFGIIRSLMPFRLPGTAKDYIVVGTDSGRLTILEYRPKSNTFEVVQQETMGKTGVRRIVPGEYLATDPRGRALMVGAVERQKMVYILNRDATADLTISSPLEAHKVHTLVFDCVALDVGFENPIFACLEVNYGVDQNAREKLDKMLTYYELDLGLNHVTRKWSEPVDRESNLLLALPGGALTETTIEGPSGVLVCSEGYIVYRHQGVPEHRVTIPRRRTPDPSADRPMLIVAGVVHKLKDSFFTLVQSEEGDLYKVTVDWIGEEVSGLRIKYFDTIAPAVSLCILKAGFLFAASEYGNHTLYQFEQLGDDDDVTEYNSQTLAGASSEPPCFTPRPLTNLAPIDELETLDPVLYAHTLNLGEEETPQIYALCGRGARSTFKVLRHGLEASEAASSELPGNPMAIWSTKLTAQDTFDTYIAVSFVDATLVLSIGETVEEVVDSGFVTNQSTLAVQQLGVDSVVQVYPEGYRRIYADKRTTEWRPPNQQHILKVATNSRQLVLALSSGDIVYFELDATDHLQEADEVYNITEEVTALALGSVPEGHQRFPFVAVGLADSTVRLLGLDPDRLWQSTAMQVLAAVPASLSLLEITDLETSQLLATLYLYAGLKNGLLVRTVVDSRGGQLTETRTRFLGPKAVQLFPIRTPSGTMAMLALSSRPWLSYTYQGRMRLAPIAYDMLTYASAFCSEPCPEGIVAIAENTLRILTVERLGSPLNQVAVPLKYTPRRSTYHPTLKHFVVIEADHRTCAPDRLSQLAQGSMAEGEQWVIPGDQPDGPVAYHYPAPVGHWASCVRVLNPLTGETIWLEDFTKNEAAISVALVTFSTGSGDQRENTSSEPLLVVGSARDLQITHRSFSAAFITVYRFLSDDQEGSITLEQVHKTEVDGLPQVMEAFQGHLLVGMGPFLRIYDMGKRKLLRKCQAQVVPNMVMFIQTQGNRIVVGDVQESIFFVQYRPQDNRLAVFADDILPRWFTTGCFLDYDTVAGADKFGNVFTLRLSRVISDKIDQDATGNLLYHQKHWLQGAAHKFTNITHYYLGDTVTTLEKTSLVPGGRQILLYTTLLGAVGVLIPVLTQSDGEFWHTLERQLRQACPPLGGRDHLAYRSYYVPVRGVIDGDLCEQFNTLSLATQEHISEELDRTPSDVSKKLEDMRTLFAF
ncbi:pre-mRNA-splicing factor rse1 [Dispira simplex]|nr:pre-mRNA-splicing factor rse1 [Dispira simplex]